MTTADEDIDVDELVAWLREVHDTSVSGVRVSRLAGGNSSGAWKLAFTTADGDQALVLKASNDEGIVFDGGATREAEILAAASRAGAPVPAVTGIDTSGRILGRPSFVMAHVDGRAVPDGTPAGIHGDGWFRDAEVAEQQAVWFSFVRALGSLHAADLAGLEVATYGPDGVASMLGYWRRSLLDAAPAELVPRQLRALDWLGANLPAGADDAPALCMGDARPGNALLDGTDVEALVDFEVAYVGNPAADIGYCVVFERVTRILSEQPAAGIPTPEETWAHWGAATGRSTEDRDYWTAFGTTVMCITGTRAMLGWGMPVETVDADNLVVTEWEALIDRASG
jgi:aminoglycoside phosphotransferase (APT) family kinase protein